MSSRTYHRRAHARVIMYRALLRRAVLRRGGDGRHGSWNNGGRDGRHPLSAAGGAGEGIMSRRAAIHAEVGSATAGAAPHPKTGLVSGAFARCMGPAKQGGLVRARVANRRKLSVGPSSGALGSRKTRVNTKGTCGLQSLTLTDSQTTGRGSMVGTEHPVEVVAT